ncbi:rubrerythrin family protein [Halomarina ordinaria]|uniref:Rubrerythrin family protein n=1 Tax=Halomarina ordinaria TaxID=3033939 RepID=A0ABD5UBU9_9EURY|nr:rubrerythrin family protein [Halomarina sp. PSRA2]
MTSTSEDFLDRVRSENRTALSRLGSSKALYADTGGDIDVAPVLRAAATAEHAAMETFETWAEEEDGAAGEAFAATASEERDHYERVVARLDGDDPYLDETPAIQRYLRDLDDTLDRAGGFVGRTVAAEKSKDQLVGFFVGQADPQSSQAFREMGGDLDDQLDRGVDLLAELCESDEDWGSALEAASGAIQAAYEEYTERLNDLGVNPKPVC